MGLTKINELGKTAGFLETKKLAELELEKKYLITRLRKITTMYGLRITVDLEKCCTVFLPTRVSKAFKDDEFEKMVKVCSDNQLYLKYLGGKYNIFEFLCKYAWTLGMSYTSEGNVKHWNVVCN